MTRWPVGRFMMKGDIVVLIEEEPQPGRYGIEYMQLNYDDREQPAAPFSGGGYCWCVGGDDLSPVTDPILILRCLLTDATRKKRAAEAEIEREQKRIDQTSYALHAIISAQRAATSPGPSTATTESP